MKSIKDKLLSVELLVCAFALLSFRAAFIGANIGDALVFVAISALYGYNKYLASKIQVNDQADKMQAELTRINALITQMSVSQVSKPNQDFYNMRKF